MNTRQAHSLPEEFLVLPLQDFVVFPSMSLPVFVARERSINTVDAAVAESQFILLVAQKSSEILSPQPDDLHPVGSIVRIVSSERLPDGRVKIQVEGIAAARVHAFVCEAPVLRARVQLLPNEEPIAWSPEVEAIVRSVRQHVEELLPLLELDPEISAMARQVEEPWPTRRPSRFSHAFFDC